MPLTATDEIDIETPGADEAELRTALKGLVGQFSITLEEFGGVGDGTTDNTAALNLALAHLAAHNGGQIDFRAATYRINSAVVLPNDGSTPPKQVPIKFAGAGSWWSGQGTPLYGSTVLDFRSNDALGKLQTYGLGLFDCEGVTFADEGTNSNPFVYTTNTTLRIVGNAFVGNTTKEGVLCDQDAIVLGGNLAVSGAGGTDDGFQGYGTIISGNYFSNIRRAVYGRTYFNGNVIRDNTIWGTCGSNLAGGAAIEIDGGPDFAVGNTISCNLIELPGYVYGIKLSKALYNNIDMSQGFDPGAGTLGMVYIPNYTSHSNVIRAGFSGNYATVPYYVAPGDGLDSNHYFASFYSDTNRFQKSKFIAGSGGTIIQPDSLYGPNSVASLLQVKRAAGEANDAGAILFEVIDRGGIKIKKPGGTGNANNTMIDMEAAVLDLNGARWAYPGVGGNMAINSGTGGSYLDLTNFGVRFFSQASAYQCRIGAGLAGMKWGTSSTADDLGISRNAAGVLEVNSGTAGTLRDAKVRSVIQSPPASVAPAVNGEMVVEATSNTTLTFKLKGSDGTVRTGTITLI